MATKKILTNLDIDGSVDATSFVKDSGTSSQILMADGSVSSKITNNNQITNGAGYLTSFTDTDTTYSVQDGELSEINFTSADHTKLNGIATGATNVTNNNQITNGAGYITGFSNTQLSHEQVQDIVGGMVSSNTETNIAVTYNDITNKLDFVSTDTNTNTQLSNAEVEAIIATNTAGFITTQSDTQDLSIVGHTISLTNGGSVTVPDNNTTYSVQDGQLSQINFTSADHTKLNGIATSATNVTNNNQITNGAGYITSFTDTNTQLSTEAVQDIVGGMISGNTETNIAVTYDDATGTLDFVSTDTDTTYSVQDGQLSEINFTSADHTKLNGIATSATNVTNNNQITNGAGYITSFTDTNTQLSTEAVQDIIGAMVAGNTETNIAVTYNDTTGKLDFVSTDTDTDTTYSVQDGQLSEINFTSADHTKLNGIETGATKVNNNNQITNGAGYITSFDITSQTDSKYLRSNTTDIATGAITFSNSTASTSKTTGAVIVTGGVGISGALNVGGDITAFSTSDRRLKDNIKPIENALEKVEKISGNTYTWNEKELLKKGNDIGVIAQEIEAVLPEAVTDRDNGYKAVNYEKIIPLLIEAIKDLKLEIDELKSK